MFLNSWAFVLGALAVGLPVLIHRFTRPKPKRVPISTIRFIQDAVRQRRARYRLRDFLILSLRTLAVILLALTLARPLSGRRDRVADSSESDVLRVVLFDTSQSMATRLRGIELFERGRPLAARKLEFQSGLKTDLILAAARPRAVFGILSTNFSALQEQLSIASPRPERLNVQPALNKAAELLSRGSETEKVRRELVIISDFQRSNWSSADFSVLPGETEIQLQSVSSGEDAPNLGLLSVSAQGRAEVARELRMEVEIGNYSSTPRMVRAEISLGDGVYQLEGNCAPNTRTVLTTEIHPPVSGWLMGEARLLGIEDALPADNRRPCVIEVRPPPVFVLITRQPEDLRPSSSYFIERGLLPLEAGEGRLQTRLVRLDSGDLDPEVLGSAELIVLDHPGRLGNEAINQLAALLRRGRGVLYVASERIDATNLRLLSDAAGAGLQMPVDFLPPAESEMRRNLLLTEPRQDRPPFSIFGDNLNAAIGPLRFSGGLATRRKEGGLEDDILASLSDRSALLVVTSSDAGALAVLNADMERSNLHRSGLYVPLLGELVQNHLLQSRQGIRESACGEPVVVELPDETGGIRGLKITGPGPHAGDPGTLSEESHGVVWSVNALNNPGVYQVKRREETKYALAAAVPPEESDLRRLPADVFQERLASGRSIQYRTIEDLHGEESDRMWIWAALACMICLMGEVATLKLFRT